MKKRTLNASSASTSETESSASPTDDVLPADIAGFEWPVFRSFAECQAVTGIPIEVLRAAKHQGCPAMIGYRVHLGVFIRWFFQHHETFGKDTLKVRLDLQQERALRERAQRMLLEQELEMRREEYVKFADVERWLTERVVRPIASFFMSMPSAWSKIVNPTDPATGKAGLEKLAGTVKDMIEMILATRPTGYDAETGESPEESDVDAGPEDAG